MANRGVPTNWEDQTGDKDSLQSSLPSWIRLLDPTHIPDQDPGPQPPHSFAKQPLPDDLAQPEVKDASLWYMSPFLNKPVVGYYNRISQSNLSLVPPLGGSALEYSGSGVGGWMKGEVTSYRHRPSHVSQGEQGVYSELNPPWPPEQHLNASLASLEHRASPPLASGHDNQQVLPGGVNGSVDGVSRERPEILKPEDYLSGLQTETYSWRSPQAPCGRCTRLVTSLLVLMGLAIVGLATALTVSVLTQSDGAGTESTQGGYPVVRAIMKLKILNKNFSADMGEPDSDTFASVAAPYSTELDRLFLASPLAAVYRGNKVTALGPGSISVRTELLFLDTGLVTKGEIVEDVIKSAERASQWDESDARAMGQFVVCSDCVTVSLNFTRVPKLPPQPVLDPPDPGVPANATSTQTPAPHTGGETAEPTTTISMPTILVSNSTHYVTDGSFVITCDVTNAWGWSLVTLEFRADNSSVQSMTVLVAVHRKSPFVAVVADSAMLRLSAFPDTSSNHVSLVVNVTEVTCADRGDYLCRVTMISGEMFSGVGHIGILDLPSLPVITPSWDSKAWDATPVYRCSARLGYPPGSLSFSVVKDEQSPWERLALTEVTSGAHCQARGSITVSALHQALRGNVSRLVCRVHSEHLQLIDPSKFSDVLHLHHNTKLEIQTRSTSVDGGLAAVRCRLLLPPAWSRLTLLRVTPHGQEEVTSLLSDGSVAWKDNYLRHRTLMTTNVSEGLAELNVFIFSVKCVDEGTYGCSLQPTLNISSPQAPLHVTARPNQPVLTIPADIYQHSQPPFTITCKAKVGRPPGSLVLAVRHPSETVFREVNFNEQTTIPLACTTEVRGTFYAGAGSLHNGSLLSCSVLPHPTLGEAADAYDVVRVFNVLPDSLCQGQPETNISHPTDCQHVIYCKNDVIAGVHRCPDGFCFDKTSGSCSMSDRQHNHPERRHGPCYPDKDQVTLAHSGQCTAFIQCHRGHEVIQHCPTAHLYVTKRQCSDDVTQTECYRGLDREATGVATNTSVLPFV